MRNSNFLSLVLFAILLAACGNDDAAEPPTTEAAPSSASIEAVSEDAEVAAATQTPEAGATDNNETRYINHDKDEVEFSLKRSLDGAQSRLEDATNPDQIETIKNDIAEIQAQLDAL